MTSMLYTTSMMTIMNKKPNVPGEIFLGDQDYSWRMDWNVNGWLFVATIISGVCDIMFPHTVQQWALPWHLGIVLAEFLAILLWTRSLARWIRGMDELHRQITVSAVAFAVSATFFFVMIWHRLEVAGVFQAIFPGRKSWDILTVGHCFLLLTLFYFVGQTRFNRRYK